MIEVQELTKDFTSGGQTLRAVDRLTLTVGRGEVYGLLGPNGAGKTTSLRMILGLLAPTSGDAIIGGARVSTNSDAVKQRIGLVSASSGLYQWLSPRETLSYFADLYQLPRERTEQRIAELESLLDLSRFMDRRCANLSTGQKQRVTLARALLHDPPVMLLDEPTRGLDIVGTHVIFEYVAQLRSLGKAVILSTHRLDEATQVCDRLGLLHAGQLRYEGSFAALQEQTGRGSLYEMFLDLLGQPASLNGVSA
ncbi:ATP-binding cassette domain-containing protein [bacterium]|nr:ATP-binding cassette domain-containing protein [bacterium]